MQTLRENCDTVVVAGIGGSYLGARAIIENCFFAGSLKASSTAGGIGIGIDRLVMLMTGKFAIGEVMLFPQMKPEVKAPRDKDELFLAKGIPADIIPILRKAGYNLVATLEGVNPAKLQQQIIEIIKKYKLEVERPCQDAITEWVK